MQRERTNTNPRKRDRIIAKDTRQCKFGDDVSVDVAVVDLKEEEDDGCENVM